jgi:hypothetical protein
MTKQFPRQEKADEQGNKIIVGSPLALIGIFVAVLRERFSVGNGPPDYLWQENLTNTKLVIESGFSPVGNKERNKRPAIFIDKDESVYGKIILGDRVGVRWTNMQDVQWTLSTAPILIECVASRRGESANIGDIVQWTLHASSDAIQAGFGLHDMSPPTLGRTVPYEADREAFTTPVSFQVQYNMRWNTTPIAPLIQEVRMKIQQANAETPEEALVQIALNSTGNLPEP